MADLTRIKANVAKMASMNAPEQDIDGYIASEGVSVDDVRNFSGQKDSVATQGLGYVKEHPFKSLFQGVPETMTGKTMEQMATENVNSPDFAQSPIAPFDKNLSGAKSEAEGKIIGGQALDMATSPINFLGGPLLRGAGKAIEMTGLVSKLGKPLVAKTMSFFSGVPERDVAKAIDNPDMLSSQWLAKEGGEVKNLYKQNITPALENLNNRVDTVGLGKSLEDEIKLMNSGEPTRAATTMSNAEKSKVIKWLDDVKSGSVSLNKLDATLGEIDKGLGKVYRRAEKEKLQPISTTFEALSTKIRGGLTELRNQQYPQLAPVWDRYANYKNAQRIAQSFDSWHPRLSNFVATAGLLGPIGLHNPAVFGAGVAGTIPKAQSLAIQTGGGIAKAGQTAAKAPFLPISDGQGEN